MWRPPGRRIPAQARPSPSRATSSRQSALDRRDGDGPLVFDDGADEFGEFYAVHGSIRAGSRSPDARDLAVTGTGRRRHPTRGKRTSLGGARFDARESGGDRRARPVARRSRLFVVADTRRRVDDFAEVSSEASVGRRSARLVARPIRLRAAGRSRAARGGAFRRRALARPSVRRGGSSSPCARPTLPRRRADVVASAARHRPPLSGPPPTEDRPARVGPRSAWNADRRNGRRL